MNFPYFAAFSIPNITFVLCSMFNNWTNQKPFQEPWWDSLRDFFLKKEYKFQSLTVSKTQQWLHIYLASGLHHCLYGLCTQGKGLHRVITCWPHVNYLILLNEITGMRSAPVYCIHLHDPVELPAHPNNLTLWLHAVCRGRNRILKS